MPVSGSTKPKESSGPITVQGKIERSRAMGGLLIVIPTAGSLGAAILVGVFATAPFPSIVQALLVPSSFLARTITMGAFVSRHIMGRRLFLNPVVIFLCLSFLGWL